VAGNGTNTDDVMLSRRIQWHLPLLRNKDFRAHWA